MRDELRETVARHAERAQKAEQLANKAAGMHAAAVRDHGRLHERLSGALRKTRRDHGGLAKQYTKLAENQHTATKAMVREELHKSFSKARFRGHVAPHNPDGGEWMDTMKKRRPVIPGEFLADISKADRKERARSWHARGPGGVEVDKHPMAKGGRFTHNGCGPKHFALGKC